MGAIHKIAATLGDSPIARALRGNFSSQRSLPHLAKHFSLCFLFLLRAKKPHANENLSGSTPPSRHNADYCFHMAKISDKDLRELKTCVCRQPVRTVERSLTQVFRRNRTDFDAWGRTIRTIARRPSVSSTSRKTSFSLSLRVERWRAEHQLQFPSSYRCTLHMMYRMQVSQIWQTRGGRETVTKANNRKHKTRIAETLGVEPFSVGKTKPSLAADNRSPCH